MPCLCGGSFRQCCVFRPPFCSLCRCLHPSFVGRSISTRRCISAPNLFPVSLSSRLVRTEAHFGKVLHILAASQSRCVRGGGPAGCRVRLHAPPRSLGANRCFTGAATTRVSCRMLGKGEARAEGKGFLCSSLTLYLPHPKPSLSPSTFSSPFPLNLQERGEL